MGNIFLEARSQAFVSLLYTQRSPMFVSLPHSFPLLSDAPPHLLILPKPGTSSYIFFVPFLTSTSLDYFMWLHMLRIKTHCPSDKSLFFSLSYSSLWVTSPGSPSSFWSIFLSEPLQILQRWRESQQYRIFLTSLSRKHSQKTSSQRFFILFLLWCLLWDW